MTVHQPNGLSDDAAKVWRLLAPLAIEAGTLTTTTSYAFAMLCTVEARRLEMEASIAREGLTVAGAAHSLINPERLDRQRVEQGMARFMITALGRPMKLIESQEVDPFAEFDAFHVSHGGKRYRDSG